MGTLLTGNIARRSQYYSAMPRQKKTGKPDVLAVQERKGVAAPEREIRSDKPVYPAWPIKGEVNFSTLRATVMAKISKARAYLAK